MSWLSGVDNFELEDCDVWLVDTLVGDSLKLVCDADGSTGRSGEKQETILMIALLNICRWHSMTAYKSPS